MPMNDASKWVTFGGPRMAVSSGGGRVEVGSELARDRDILVHASSLQNTIVSGSGSGINIHRYTARGSSTLLCLSLPLRPLVAAALLPSLRRLFEPLLVAPVVPSAADPLERLDLMSRLVLDLVEQLRHLLCRCVRRVPLGERKVTHSTSLSIC